MMVQNTKGRLILRLFVGPAGRNSESQHVCCFQTSLGLATKKTKVVAKVASVFNNDSDEET